MSKDFLIIISEGFQQVVDLLMSALNAPRFIRDHKLWKGFFDHKWVSMFSLAIAILFSYLLYNNITHRETVDLDGDIPNEEIAELTSELKEEIKEIGEDLSELNEDELGHLNLDTDEDKNDIKEAIKEESGFFFFSGGMKYLLLILLEVLIFHFAVKTYSILKGRQVVLKFNDFYRAEIRMLTVMLASMIKTFLIYILLSVVFGIFGYSFLKKPLMFLVYAYFIGHAFLDNYNEQHELSIKESDQIIKKRFGASTALGLIASVIMHVPIIGPFTAPLFCSVIATLYGYRYQLEKVEIDKE